MFTDTIPYVTQPFTQRSGSSAVARAGRRILQVVEDSEGTRRLIIAIVFPQAVLRKLEVHVAAVLEVDTRSFLEHDIEGFLANKASASRIVSRLFGNRI